MRLAALIDDKLVFAALAVDLGSITAKELRRAAQSLRSGKAAGPDGNPIEFCKVVLNSADTKGAE